MHKIINLARPSYSEVEFSISEYPDGHKHLIFINGLKSVDSVNVISRITSYDDIFILKQLVQICELNMIELHHLEITYLLSGRHERQFVIGEAVDLKIILNDIKSLGFNKLSIIDSHSAKSKNITSHSCFCEKSNKNLVVYLDMGAYDKARYSTSICSFYASSFKQHYSDYIYFTKERIDNKIKVTLAKDLDNSKTYEDIVVLDDLCDGGKTFIQLASVLRKLKPTKLILFVIHAIQKEGLLKVAELYDKVYITNSYHDWQNENLPENINVNIIC